MNKLVADIIDSSRESPLNQDAKWISTGSTLLNLSCSGEVDKGLKGGCIYNLVGSSSSGKSMLALSILAEAHHQKDMSDYSLIYDDCESACSFDLSRLFGEAVAESIIDQMPSPPSNFLEDFYHRINTLLFEGKQFIYILDSLDSLTTDTEEDKTVEILDARARGKKVTGSYGMAKAKMISQIMRQICTKLSATNSILIIISQTRDNVSPMSFATQTRSGGRALEFYSSIVMWMSMKDKIHKTVLGNRYQTGVVSKVKITKNKFSGRVREVPLTIKYDYGVDYLQDCIDYLVSNKVITKVGKSIVWGKIKGTTDTVIKIIEQEGLEDKLCKEVSKVYWGIENKLVNKDRKRKYE